MAHKLTPEEKKKVHDYALKFERERHGADANITIVVADELTEEGKAQWRAIIQRTQVLPKDGPAGS